MNRPPAIVRSTATLAVLVCAIGLIAGGESRTAPGTKGGKPPAAVPGASTPGRRAYKTEKLRGRVVWLETALADGFGVSTELEAAETTVVVETADGKLWPVIPDTRGRAFAVDARLRDTQLELLVRRYDDAPMIQVIRVFRPKADGLYEIDYWCDVCAIPMVILKPCECCQGPTRLRERPVAGGSAGG